MADQTTSNLVIDATPAQVMAVIADFEAYPEWAQGMKRVQVVKVGPEGRASEVHFELEATPIKDSYTLAYTWKAQKEVRWTLVEAENILKTMDGAYLLEDNGDASTTVTYQLVVDVRMPLLGMMKRKAEKVIIDTALKELKKRVEG